MIKLLKSVTAPEIHSAKPIAPLRSVRPSLLDIRFTGDPWVVDHADGTASLRLDDYRLARIQTMPLDLLVHPASRLTRGTVAMPGALRGRWRHRRPHTNGWRCLFQ